MNAKQLVCARQCSPPARFECLLGTRCAMYRCPRRPKGRSWLTIHSQSGECRFNARFLDAALENGLTVVECPITFHERVGNSEGGNTSDLRPLKVGCVA